MPQVTCRQTPIERVGRPLNRWRCWSTHPVAAPVLLWYAQDPHERAVTAKLRILFVDDEPPVLTAIERQLRKDRARWEMVFVVGGQRGLEEIRNHCFSVVVSDFRMPVVDGVALLNATADVCPSAVRIMLSGDAEAQAMAHAVPALHQLLSKPCDAATLRDAIERGISAAQAHRQPSSS
jgi:DNA-binding NtrC family response regulator